MNLTVSRGSGIGGRGVEEGDESEVGATEEGILNLSRASLWYQVNQRVYE